MSYTKNLGKTNYKEKYLCYPVYKKSCADWLRDIPEHWRLIRLSHIFKRVKRIDYAEKELLSVYRDYGVIPKNSRDDNNNKPSEDLSLYQLVEPNDLVLNKMKAWQGSVAISDVEGIVSPAYFVYKPIGYFQSHCFAKYIHYLLRSSEYVSQYFRYSKGIRVNQWDLDPELFKSLELLLPDYNEQVIISTFLDKEILKIDKLILKQERLIELLKEKRQAVISHAVTKGLNSDVEMKYSCVEWLGDIPEHWSIVKFSYCVSIRSGLVDPKSEQYKKYWLIAPNHIQSGEGRILNLEKAEEQGAESSKYLCKKGEVIYSKIRPALAKVCISPENNVLCSADMYPMTARSGLTNDYLSWFLLSSIFTRFAVNQADRVAMPKINRESLAECKIPFPEKSEQIEIAYYLQRITKKLDDLIVKSQERISLLKERRSALISAAVTGKIDVRNCQPDAKDVA